MSKNKFIILSTLLFMQLCATMYCIDRIEGKAKSAIPILPVEQQLNDPLQMNKGNLSYDSSITWITGMNYQMEDTAIRFIDPKIAVVQEIRLTTFGYWTLTTQGRYHGNIIYEVWINGPTRDSCERHKKEEYEKGCAVVYGNGVWKGLKYNSVTGWAERRTQDHRSISGKTPVD